ncbi:hypothetical protein RAA17_01460 [Komagataeibacter rhaeticus]|nr:hypothetical protein [Komagataeibacter rhaeticus]
MGTQGAAQLVRIRGGLNAAGQPVAYDLDTSYPSNVSPLLALVLTGVVPAEVPPVAQMGDRTSVPPYDYPNARITVQDMPPLPGPHGSGGIRPAQQLCT